MMNNHYYQDPSLSFNSEDDSFYEDPRNIMSLNNHQDVVLTDPFLDDDFYYNDGEQHGEYMRNFCLLTYSYHLYSVFSYTIRL